MMGRLPVGCSVLAMSVLHAALLRSGQAAQEPASIDGQIANSVTGEPVSNAVVHLIALRYKSSGNIQPQANSQGDGTFHFDSVPPGNYVITGERVGFVPNQFNANSGFITVGAGQAISGVTVLLTPQGSISGRVEAEDGTPLRTARVEALAAITTHGHASFRLYSTANADADGKFSLENLPPNDYYIVAEPSAEQQPAKDGDLVRTVYPRSLDIDGGSTVPVSAGQSVTDILVRVRRAVTFHIHGKVSDAPAEARTLKLTVAVSPRGAVDSPILTRNVHVSGNRTFDIAGLTPGAYTLRLTGDPNDAGRRNALLARQDVEIGAADLDGIVLSITPPLSLTGRIRLETSGNMPLPRVSLMARPLEDLPHATQGFADVASDGSFTFDNLDPGLYVFHAFSAAPGMYVKSLTLNQQDVLNKEADLSAMSAGRLEVVLSLGAGEVDGTVLGTGDAPVTIMLVPEVVGPDGSGVLFTYSRQDGHFVFKNVRPGKYFGYAVQRGDPNLWQDPDFLRVVQSQGSNLEVNENSRRQVQLPLLALEQVEQAAGRLGLHVQ